MLTFITILGFVSTMLSIFFVKGSMRIIAEPYFDRTLPYAYVVIIIFATLLVMILIYRLITHIIFSPMNFYDDYRKRQVIKHEKLCVLNYVKCMGLERAHGWFRAKDDYKSSLEALRNKPAYWLLWFAMKQEVPDEYEYYIHSNKELLFVAIFNKVNNLMETQGYRQALENLLIIQDFAVDFPWFYEKLITCHLQMHEIDKAFGAYDVRRRQIGPDHLLESKIYLVRAELEPEHKLQSLKKAYDLVKGSSLNQTGYIQQVVSYIKILIEIKDYKTALAVLKYEITRKGWSFGEFTDEVTSLAKQIILGSTDQRAVLNELISAEKNFVETSQKVVGYKDDEYDDLSLTILTAEIYIRLDMYDKAKPILISVLDKAPYQALCMMVYIESKIHGYHENTVWLQRIFE